MSKPSKAAGRRAVDADRTARELAGRRCLVTGGGSGIGAGIARALALRGARVGLLGRRRQALQQVATSLPVVDGEGARVVVGDVTDRTGLRTAVARLARSFGGLDIVVANAGIGGPNRCALPGPERWDEVVRTNLDGVFFTVLAALPHLADGGRIVVISSVLGRFGVPGYTAYCASKHGVIGLAKALALELAPRRITVNVVCPGWVDTDMATAGMQAMADAMGTDLAKARKQALSAVPLGRILQPDEIGETVAFLCSRGASGMTGQAISHCGGQVMW